VNESLENDDTIPDNIKQKLQQIENNLVDTAWMTKSENVLENLENVLENNYLGSKSH